MVTSLTKIFVSNNLKHLQFTYKGFAILHVELRLFDIQKIYPCIACLTIYFRMMFLYLNDFHCQLVVKFSIDL